MYSMSSIERRRTALRVASILLFLATAVLVIASSATPATTLPFGATYHPLPKDATTYGELTLRPLSPASYSSVRISPIKALSIAKDTTGIAVSRKVTEVTSLGSLTDAGLRHRGVLIAKGTPAYVVTFSGLVLATLGPTAGIVTNEAVAVSATTGKVIESVKFN